MFASVVNRIPGADTVPFGAVITPVNVGLAVGAAPKFVSAVAAVVAPVPPFAKATVPVTLAAVPVVFWLPAVFTPGKLMLAEPLNDTPPMVRAVVSVSAVPAVATLRFATRVVEVITSGAVPIATVLVNCPDMAKVVTLDNAPVTLALPLKFCPHSVRVVVSVAADPVVFWLPAVFTPGKLMLADPLKETPPMVRAV